MVKSFFSQQGKTMGRMSTLHPGKHELGHAFILLIQTYVFWSGVWKRYGRIQNNLFLKTITQQGSTHSEKRNKQA